MPLIILLRPLLVTEFLFQEILKTGQKIEKIEFPGNGYCTDAVLHQLKQAHAVSGNFVLQLRKNRLGSVIPHS